MWCLSCLAGGMHRCILCGRPTNPSARMCGQTHAQTFNRDSVPAAAAACGFQSNRPFVAYRWRSEVSQVAATASSCGHALGKRS